MLAMMRRGICLPVALATAIGMISTDRRFLCNAVRPGRFTVPAPPPANRPLLERQRPKLGDIHATSPPPVSLQLAASASALPGTRSRRKRADLSVAAGSFARRLCARRANDIVGRLTGQILAERLGQQFIIQNRAGAGSNIATEAVVRANPDGYTLLEASTSNAWNATLYQNLKFDFIRDIAPVASSVKTYNVMIVNSAFPAKNRSRVHRLCQGQPRQDQHGVGRTEAPRTFTASCSRR